MFDVKRVDWKDFAEYANDIHIEDYVLSSDGQESLRIAAMGAMSRGGHFAVKSQNPHYVGGWIWRGNNTWGLTWTIHGEPFETMDWFGVQLLFNVVLWEGEEDV